MVDERSLPGQFILTGSNAVDKTKILHSGNSRISRMVMLPMSLWESRESNGKISLRSLFDDPASDIDGITSDMSIEDIIFAACRGLRISFLQRVVEDGQALSVFPVTGQS